MDEHIEKIIRMLDLKPLPMEGGYYTETYRSEEIIRKECLPGRYTHAKAFSTAIFYLYTPETFSALHLLPTDEVYHFYLGDPVEMLQLKQDGSGQVIQLGQDLFNGILPQIVVPKGTWQGSGLFEGVKFALIGTTMAPAFDFDDFVPPDKKFLVETYPEFRKWIEKLV